MFLVGPRGTGRSSVAIAMAVALHKAGVVKTDRVVAISEAELPGLSDSYGPSAEALRNLSSHVQSALDGVLLIDDADRLISLSSGQVALEAGSRILDVARRYPGRLFVICTRSSDALARLDPNKRWLGQLNARKVLFPPLNEGALKAIFLSLLSAHGFQIASEAERALGLRLREIRQEGGDEFDNAHAARRFVDAVLHNHGLRLRQHPSPEPPSQRVIAAEDVRNAFSSV